MATVLHKEIVTKVFSRFVEVDNESEVSRGATYVDHLNVLKRKPNVDVVYEASERGFKEVLFRMLKGGIF
jgi:purine nucleosidase